MELKFLGPFVPDSCEFGSTMIASPFGDGVILLGCEKYDMANIYQMVPDQSSTFKWIKLKQELKYGRTSHPLVDYIDDDLVNCY